MTTLTGKVVIVTGAGSGIGVGIAEVIAERGGAVAVLDRDAASAERVAEKLQTGGGEAISVACDVSDEGQVAEAVAQVHERFGRIDGLVNNAGVNFVKPFDEMSIAEWDRVISIDLRGTFLCTHACMPHFFANGSGSVVNIASVHTQACLPGAASYDAAKWGVLGMTKALAVEYASRGIRFNCLSPGLIDTKIWQDIQAAAVDQEACLAHWRANIPAGRVGTPREMGQVAAFLLSDDASYVTGANLLADGGMTSQLISREHA
ncbi:SDR family NAD(P)-dependent oxidoreductase [Phycisphaerales bacterium AB-hyl4]|uniref:SDR family NAD(P)-dependent oxidoreductase n=1 Tax=Natronomicrosphaera hydrolytica TaxID=3242702 RepID=A0ABV4U064_9BACT